MHGLNPSMVLNSTPKGLEILRQALPGSKVGMNMNPRLTHTYMVLVVWVVNVNI